MHNEPVSAVNGRLGVVRVVVCHIRSTMISTFFQAKIQQRSPEKGSWNLKSTDLVHELSNCEKSEFGDERPAAFRCLEAIRDSLVH